MDSDCALTVPLYAARTIPAGIRRSVIQRDGLVCRLCERMVVPRSARGPYQPNTLHLDHVEHWAAGGENTVENLRVTCAECNLRRPKPEVVARQSKVRVEVRDGELCWPAGYAPPKRTRGRDLLSLPDFAAATGVPQAEALRLIAGGHLAATAASPIRVRIPKAGVVKRPLERRRTADGGIEPAWLARERQNAWLTR